MRSRFIVSKNGQTLVIRGDTYVSEKPSTMSVLTSRQFENDAPENKVRSRMRTNNDALERAFIYGQPKATSKAELRRAARLEKARALPVISNAEAIEVLNAIKRANDIKAKQEENRKEREEQARLEAIEEAKEMRKKVAEARLSTLKGLNKAG